MRLNELLKPGEGPAYQWGNNFQMTANGKYVISGADRGARSQFFISDSGEPYAINFDQVSSPPSMTLSFGNLFAPEYGSRYVNYSDLRKLNIHEAAKILNTVISVAKEFSAAHSGVPLWTFTTNSQKKAKVYKIMSAKIAKTTGGGFRVFKDPWGDYLFAVYTNEQGKEDLQKYIDHITEFNDLEENPSDI